MVVSPVQMLDSIWICSGVQPSGSGRMGFLWEKKCMKNQKYQITEKLEEEEDLNLV